jgi:hypothetical protein
MFMWSKHRLWCAWKHKRWLRVPVTFGRPVTGDGPALVTFGYQAHGQDRHALLQSGSVVIGCIGPVAGFGCPVTGAERLLGKIDLHRAAASTFLRCDA